MFSVPENMFCKLIFIKINFCDYRHSSGVSLSGIYRQFFFNFQVFSGRWFCRKSQGRSHIHEFSSGGVIRDNVYIPQLPIVLELRNGPQNAAKKKYTAFFFFQRGNKSALALFETLPDAHAVNFICYPYHFLRRYFRPFLFLTYLKNL
jgi:hypothetical protein